VFSGLVKGIGRILHDTDMGGDLRLTISLEQTAIEQLEPGASIAVNGVCLTATECHADRFDVDVSTETLRLTTLSAFHAGARVNLEPSLRLGDPMHGHWVLGHVDGVGRVVDVKPAARSSIVVIELPAALIPYVAQKGSIAVDGVSLTVNAVDKHRFEVNIVPHTSEMTVISDYQQGTAVNIEVDIIARYVDQLLSTSQDVPRPQLTP